MKQLQQFIILFLLFPCALNAQWTVQASGTTKVLFDVDFPNINTGFAVGEEGIILKTTNKGINWIAQLKVSSAYLYGVSFIDANTGWIASESGVIHKTTNGGNTWEFQLPEEFYTLRAIYFYDANIGAAVGDLGYIIKTTNGGQNWVQYSRDINQNLSAVFFVNPNTGWAVGGNGMGVGTILKTSNGGDNWVNQNSGVDEYLASVFFTDASTGMIVGSNGIILRTTNGGINWIPQPSGTNEHILGLTFANSNTGVAVGFNSKILRTTNGGNNWLSQTSGIIRDLEKVSFPDPNLGWAVGDRGVILRYTGPAPLAPQNLQVQIQTPGKVQLSWNEPSDNEQGFVLERKDFIDTNWTIIDSFPANSVQCIDSNLLPREYFWRIYSYNASGNSGYSNIVSTLITGAINGNGAIPVEYALHQNFPNPFNPVTKISYDLHESGKVNLKIYDLSGKEAVSLINNEVQSAGYYTVIFNAKNLASGVYFYRLTAGDFVSTKKLMLIK
jgi:photosystem II stability/assembly factor-like uncharacterized protein